MILQSAGNIDLMENKRNIWKNDLVCFVNNCKSNAIFKCLAGKVVKCEYLSLDDLSQHLIYLANQFGESQTVHDCVQQIQNSLNKPMILGVAKKIYGIVSDCSNDTNRGIFNF